MTNKQPPTSISGLENIVLEAIGETLYVKTQYGWGWTKNDNKDALPTYDFELILDELWDYDGERRGGIGQITTKGHLLNSMWVVFSTRHAGHYNFTDKVGIYNLSVGRKKPILNEEGWPLFQDTVIGQGFGEISVANENTF